jgi:hypothetical protein
VTVPCPPPHSPSLPLFLSFSLTGTAQSLSLQTSILLCGMHNPWTGTALPPSLLYCTALYCTVLYCTVLYSPVNAMQFNAMQGLPHPTFCTVSLILPCTAFPLLSTALHSLPYLLLYPASPLPCTTSPTSPTPVSPSISSPSQGTREAMYLAYVDKLGVLKAQKILPDKAIGQKKEVTSRT